MSKDDVLTAFETDMSDPGSYKSGEYLEEHILIRASNALLTDRSGLVAALQEWLSLRDEPRTMLAVTMARKLTLQELKADIEALRKEVSEGRVFPHYYLRKIDATLEALNQVDAADN
jgi:hypothetical protein